MDVDNDEDKPLLNVFFDIEAMQDTSHHMIEYVLVVHPG